MIGTINYWMLLSSSIMCHHKPCYCLSCREDYFVIWPLTTIAEGSCQKHQMVGSLVFRGGGITIKDDSRGYEHYFRFLEGTYAKFGSCCQNSVFCGVFRPILGRDREEEFLIFSVGYLRPKGGEIDCFFCSFTNLE